MADARPPPPYPSDGLESRGARPGENEDDNSSPLDPAAIRELLSALARLARPHHHSTTEIPRETNTPISRNLTHVDPRHANYDEKKTVDYHIRQLPSGSALDFQHEGNMSQALSLDTTFLDWSQLAAGTCSSVLLWVSDPHGPRHDRHVEYDEFSYNEDGYICSFERNNSAETDEPPPLPGTLSYTPPRREIREHIVGNFSFFLFFFFPPNIFANTLYRSSKRAKAKS